MSVFKTTFSRALSVIPSDNCNVPSPHLLVSSANTSYDSGDPNVLTDNTVAFLVNPTVGGRQYKVNVGDVVYCYDTGLSATILEVIDKFNLLLNADIFLGGTTLPYYIYQEGAQTGLGNQGAYLYIGVAGNVKVTTIGQDIVIFFGVPSGTTLPIQVVKVHRVEEGGTSAEQIIALW